MYAQLGQPRWLCVVVSVSVSQQLVESASSGRNSLIESDKTQSKKALQTNGHIRLLKSASNASKICSESDVCVELLAYGFCLSWSHPPCVWLCLVCVYLEEISFPKKNRRRCGFSLSPCNLRVTPETKVRLAVR
ncbi:uncharacterized protein LOC108088124 isoform X1 [Drosophila ficusphila]|uniref:uncharacterized protein LOC108088124 isoform X1 n=1 Tax=Drosophila ficusphila TaxID=30025 RepID=UPI0007E8555B|nr:uncharacterized protein LOC108088124 isoform X1 [Drosophila ficusphila]